MKIISELRKIREEQKCSQDALSALTGINSRSYMNSLENGWRNPSLMTLTKWADALGYELTLRPK
jgi:transcriptional regulator with XRE-family HTH domain